jgi:hypothetical protein
MTQRVNQALLYPLSYASGDATITTTTTTTVAPTLIVKIDVPLNSGIADFTKFNKYIGNNENGGLISFEPSGSLKVSQIFNIYNSKNRSSFVPMNISNTFIPVIPTQTTILQPPKLFQYQRYNKDPLLIDRNFKTELKNNIQEDKSPSLGGSTVPNPKTKNRIYENSKTTGNTRSAGGEPDGQDFLATGLTFTGLSETWREASDREAREAKEQA